MENKFKATLSLIFSAAGAAVTYPVISPLSAAVSSFTLGLLNHGFMAATIGGFADWFGVTALFRKPLGIGYHTEILIRNRERIMEAIVDFVSKDLLSAQNIISAVQSENTAFLLISYLEQNDGRDKVKSLVNDILFDIASTADTKSIAKTLTPIIKAQAQNIDPKQIVDVVISVLTNDKHSRRIISVLFDAAMEIFKSEPIQRAILQKISALKKEYEGESAGRSMVLAAIDLNDEKILSIVNENIEKRINGTIKTLNSDGIVDKDAITTAANLCVKFSDFLKSATSDTNTNKFFNDFKSVVSNNFDLESYVAGWLDSYLKGENFIKNQQKINQIKSSSSRIIKLDNVNPAWQSAIDNLIDEKIDEFVKSPVLQAKFDNFAQKIIESLINKYHSTIAELIHERLDALSDEDLTTFVEDKVSDDLQMIRINGAVCGGFVGIVLYLISYLIEFGTK